MASYPSASSIPWENPTPITMNFLTLKTPYGQAGKQQASQKWLYPKRDPGPLKYPNIDKANARTLWQFYQARAGAYELFSWFDAFADVYVDEYVGTGDGSETVFNLPGKSTSSRTVYVDGISQSEGVDYTFGAAGGPDGEDKITFGSPPDAGQYITISFTGILKVRCRFKSDDLKYETFYNTISKLGIELEGSLNA